MTPSLVVRGLTVNYRDGDRDIRALDGLDLEAYDGELVLLLGPSGSGKTTLLSCLAGLLTPASGSISALGREVVGLRGTELDRYRRDTVGVVFQAFNLISSLSARENVALPMRLAGTSRSAARERARELLRLVDLSERTRHRPDQLSGGQQQRVAIARALAMDAPILLADEPTAHLDVVQVEGVIELLRGLATPGRTILVSTHDDRLVPLADRVVHLGARTAVPAQASTTLTLGAGEVLFEEGSRGREVFVLLDGCVEIYQQHSQRRIKLVEPGSYFGEMGPLLGLPRSGSARALTNSTVRRLDVQEFRHGRGADERHRLAAQQESGA